MNVLGVFIISGGVLLTFNVFLISDFILLIKYYFILIIKYTLKYT